MRGFDRCAKEYKILSDKYESLKKQADMLYKALDLAYNDKDFNWNYDVVKEALKNYESFSREIYEKN